MKEEYTIGERLPRPSWLVAFVVIAILFGALMFFQQLSPGFANAGVAECRASYRKATTATDTAVIDEQRPSSQIVKKPNSETCGYWRKVGMTK